MRRGVAFCLLALLSACSEPTALLGSPSGRVVYLVVSREPASTDSVLYAFVAALQHPPRYEYITAESFTMTRRSDGAVFDWQHNGREGMTSVGVFQNTFIESLGNYELPWIGGGGRLGRQDLVAGDTLDLAIVIASETIIGSTIVPEVPMIAPRTSPEDRRVVWHSDVPATVGYYLNVTTDLPAELFTVDTTYQIVYNQPPTNERQLIVRALDANAWTYRTDSTATSAGLAGAFGLFGSTAVATVALPPPP